MIKLKSLEEIPNILRCSDQFVKIFYFVLYSLDKGNQTKRPVIALPSIFFFFPLLVMHLRNKLLPIILTFSFLEELFFFLKEKKLD